MGGGRINDFHIISTPNLGSSHARNVGLELARGDYILFVDSDDWIEPDTVELAYRKCLEDHADAVQFDYRTIDEATQRAMRQSLGSKKRLLYQGEEIARELLPIFTGFSGNSLKYFGTRRFSEGTEMNSVWRFLYKRSVLTENNVFFPEGVSLREDRLFNCRFLCYAQRVSILHEVLYNYELKKSGLMLRSLSNPIGLIKDKRDGVTERAKLRSLFLKKHGIDIFPLYSGSLVLSAFELMVKLTTVVYSTGLRGVREYLKMNDVKEAFNSIDVPSLPLKLKLCVSAVRLRLGVLMFSCLWLFSKVRPL